MDAFQVAGLALLVTAIVGGGMQAAGHTIPVIQSPVRQILLGCLGASLLLLGGDGIGMIVGRLREGRSVEAANAGTVAQAPPTATLPAVATATPTMPATATAAATATPAPTPTFAPAPAVAAARHWCRPTNVTDAIAIHARPTSGSQWLGTVPAPVAGRPNEATVIGWSDSLAPGDIPWLRITEVIGPAGDVQAVRGWIRSREPAIPSGWVDMACSFDTTRPPFPIIKLSADE